MDILQLFLFPQKKVNFPKEKKSSEISLQSFNSHCILMAIKLYNPRTLPSLICRDVKERINSKHSQAKTVLKTNKKILLKFHKKSDSSA